MNHIIKRSVFCLILICFCLIEAVAQTGRRRIIEHQVRQGETVYSIAQRYHTSVDKIYDLNPWAKQSIKVGDKIIVPADSSSATTSVAGSSKPSSRTAERPNSHTVAAGETLYRIARHYDVSEEAILRVNPGLHADRLDIGMIINLPKVSSTPTATEVSKPDTIVKPQISLTPSSNPFASSNAVRILLMLPLKSTPRYLEFYQGFLMGMNDLKKNGISMHLTVVDVADDEAVATSLNNGIMSTGFDLVIGGVTDRQIELISDATKLGYHIVPFSTTEGVGSSRMIQLNQSPTEVIERVLPRFLQMYAEQDVYFVYHTNSREDLLATRLKQELKRLERPYRLVNLANSSIATLSSNAVVVPINADKELAEEVVRSMGASSAKLFGYPQWQSYGDNFVRQLHQRRATIYSTFYFDQQSSEGRQFLTKFNAWYSKRIANHFPKFSVLGYDVARYFIRAYAAHANDFVTHGPMLASDGLQLDIELERSTKHDGYINRKFYFITFNGGAINRIALQ